MRKHTEGHRMITLSSPSSDYSVSVSVRKEASRRVFVSEATERRATPLGLG